MTLHVSERRACKVLDQQRSTQHHRQCMPDDEDALTKRIIDLATDYGRYGYRLITGLLRNEGRRVNHKRVERIWRREGLKVPKRQPKRKRLWLNYGSCVRLWPEYRNHVWSYDSATARTHDGKAFRMLNIIDEFIERLAHLFIAKGIPEHIRSDNGPEFTAKVVRKWLTDLGVKTLFIEPGSPWENGYVESFNSRLRDELLDGETFTTLFEAKVPIEAWRRHYNTVRPHSALGYRPPAPEAVILNNGYLMERLTLGVVQ